MQKKTSPADDSAVMDDKAVGSSGRSSTRSNRLMPPFGEISLAVVGVVVLGVVLRKLTSDTGKQNRHLMPTRGDASDANPAGARPELQNQYDDMQSCFAQTDPAVKSSAVLRMADFAERFAPAPEPTDANSVRSTRTQENTPYFIPVALQLTAALVAEERVVVRNAIRDALKRMARFAAREAGQALLHELITVLAEANRRAKDAFIVAMAQWAVAAHAARRQGYRDALEEAARRRLDDLPHPTGILSEEDLEFLAQETAFCRNKANAIFCLRSLMVANEEDAKEEDTDRRGMPSFGVSGRSQMRKPGTSEQARKRYAAKRAAQSAEERTKADALLLPRLETATEQLTDIRDALAAALGSDVLVAKPELMEKLKPLLTSPDPSLEGKALGKRWAEIAEPIQRLFWPLSEALPLQKCFLAGANLMRAQLQGAALSEAHLQEAGLFSAQLQKASLDKAQLQGADLWTAHLQGAMFFDAQLQTANMAGAQMQGAEIITSQCQGALLNGAGLQGVRLAVVDLREAELDSAQLQGAELAMVQLQGARMSRTRLQGAKMNGVELQGALLSAAQLQGADLWGAKLQGAYLRDAQLQSADMRRARLQSAWLVRAQLQGTDLRDAQLDKAKLYGVQVQQTGTTECRKTDFTGSAWDKATFDPTDRWMRSDEADEQMVDLQEWLKQFPIMPEDKVVPSE
jgi:uncharacterized protein YjbI with pentapeptide repeats